MACWRERQAARKAAGSRIKGRGPTGRGQPGHQCSSAIRRGSAAMRSLRHSGHFAAAVAATVLLLAPEPGAAQSNAELMSIIRQQQRQIEELSRKVDALQSQVQQATEEADAAAIAQQAEQQAADIKVEWGRPSRARMAAGRYTCSAASWSTAACWTMMTTCTMATMPLRCAPRVWHRGRVPRGVGIQARDRLRRQ
jgi:hypothetical protein